MTKNPRGDFLSFPAKEGLISRKGKIGIQRVGRARLIASQPDRGFFRFKDGIIKKVNFSR